MRQDWTGLVVGYLCELKTAGHDFDAAWELATLRFPARGRDMGEYQATLLRVPGRDESVLEFFERVCDDAWHDRRPALRHFSVSAMRDAVIDGDGGAAGRPRSRGLSEAA